jgi:hypothetical protein
MGFSIGGSAKVGGPRGAIERFGDAVEGRTFSPRVVLRLLAFVRPYSRRIAGAFAAMIASSALTLALPYLIKDAIDGPSS